MIFGVASLLLLASTAAWFLMRNDVDAGPLFVNSGIDVTLPLPPGNTSGAVWGNLELRNPARDPLIIDAIIVHSAGKSTDVSAQSYVWDADRVKIASGRSLVAWAKPIPSTWTQVPRHASAGYTVLPSSSDPAEYRSDGTVVGPELVIELAAEAKSYKIDSVSVRYHIGTTSYETNAQNSITLCPSTDLSPCGGRSSVPEP